MGKGILYIIWEERGGARGTRWEKGFYILYGKKGEGQEGPGGKRDSTYYMGRKGRRKRDQVRKGILHIIWEERGGARGTRWEKGFFISYGNKGEGQEGPGEKRDSIYHMGRKGRSMRDQVGKGILYIIWEERGGARGTRWEKGFYISYGKKGEGQEGPGGKRDSIYHMGRKGRGKRDQVGKGILYISYGKKGEEQEGPGGAKGILYIIWEESGGERGDQVRKGILYIIWEERGGARGTRWEKGFYILYGKKGEEQEGPGGKRDSIYYMGRKGRGKRDQVGKGILYIIWEERGGERGTRWEKGFYISYGKKGEGQEGPGGKRDSIYHMGRKGRGKRDQVGKGILYIIWEERGGARGTRWEKGFYISYGKKGEGHEGPGGKRDSIYHMGRKGRGKRDQVGEKGFYIYHMGRKGRSKRDQVGEKEFYISYGKKGEEQEGPGGKRDSIYHMGRKGRSKRDQVGKGILYIIWEERGGARGTRWEKGFYILYGKKGEGQEGPGGKRDSTYYMGRKGRSKRDQVRKGILHIIWEERGGARGTRWEKGFFISYGNKGEGQEGPGEKRDSIYHMGRKGRSMRDQVGKGILYIIWEERGGARGTRWEKGFYISYGKKGEGQEGPGGKRDSIYHMGRKGRGKRDQVGQKEFYISYGKKVEEKEGTR